MLSRVHSSASVFSPTISTFAFSNFVIHIPAKPNLVVVYGGAAIGRDRIGASQHVNALAVDMRLVRPKTFGDQHARLHLGRHTRMQPDIAACIAEPDKVAVADIVF